MDWFKYSFINCTHSVLKKINMGSKFFGNKNANRETNGKRQVKNSNKNSKKNYSSKLQSKGVGKTKMTGVRKVGRGN